MSQVDSSDLKMKISPKQLEDAVVFAPSQDAIMAVSPPGTAKSTIMCRAARRMGYTYKALYTATMEASDVRLPYVEEGPSGIKLASWAVSPLIPLQALAERYGEDQHFLVNLDDFPHSAPSVMRPFVRSIYGDGNERVIAEFPILDRVRFVLTGNRESDRAGSNRLDTYIANRLVIFEIEPDVDTWVSGALNGFAMPSFDESYPEMRTRINKAVAQGIPDEIIAYVKWTKQVYDFSTETRSFKSPRSLEQLGRFIRAYEVAGLGDEIIAAVAAGTLGDAEGMKFMAFRKLRDGLPSVDAILRGEDVKMPASTEILFILVTAVIRAAKREHVKAVAKLLERLAEAKTSDGMPVGVEVSAYLAQECLNGSAQALRGVRSEPQFHRWVQRNGGRYFT
jgi:hypothetical protein